MKQHVFISYSRQDYAYAKAIYDALASDPAFDPWLDVEKLLPMTNWRLTILENARGADIFVLLASNYSLQSSFVYGEWRAARESLAAQPKKFLVLVLRTPDSALPLRKGTRLPQVTDALTPERYTAWLQELDGIPNIDLRTAPLQAESAVLAWLHGRASTPKPGQGLPRRTRFYRPTLPAGARTSAIFQAFFGASGVIITGVMAAHLIVGQALTAPVSTFLQKIDLALFTGLLFLSLYFYFTLFRNGIDTLRDRSQLPHRVIDMAASVGFLTGGILILTRLINGMAPPATVAQGSASLSADGYRQFFTGEALELALLIDGVVLMLFNWILGRNIRFFQNRLDVQRWTISYPDQDKSMFYRRWNNAVRYVLRLLRLDRRFSLKQGALPTPDQLLRDYRRTHTEPLTPPFSEVALLYAPSDEGSARFLEDCLTALRIKVHQGDQPVDPAEHGFVAVLVSQFALETPSFTRSLTALAENRAALLPIILDDSALPEALADLQRVDARGDAESLKLGLFAFVNGIPLPELWNDSTNLAPIRTTTQGSNVSLFVLQWLATLCLTWVIGGVLVVYPTAVWNYLPLSPGWLLASVGAVVLALLELTLVEAFIVRNVSRRLTLLGCTVFSTALLLLLGVSFQPVYWAVELLPSWSPVYVVVALLFVYSPALLLLLPRYGQIGASGFAVKRGTLARAFPRTTAAVSLLLLGIMSIPALALRLPTSEVLDQGRGLVYGDSAYAYWQPQGQPQPQQWCFEGRYRDNVTIDLATLGWRFNPTLKLSSPQTHTVYTGSRTDASTDHVTMSNVPLQEDGLYTLAVSSPDPGLYRLSLIDENAPLNAASSGSPLAMISGLDCDSIPTEIPPAESLDQTGGVSNGVSSGETSSETPDETNAESGVVPMFPADSAGGSMDYSTGTTPDRLLSCQELETLVATHPPVEPYSIEVRNPGDSVATFDDPSKYLIVRTGSASQNAYFGSFEAFRRDDASRLCPVVQLPPLEPR